VGDIRIEKEEHVFLIQINVGGKVLPARPMVISCSPPFGAELICIISTEISTSVEGIHAVADKLAFAHKDR
jgi:hypothetical protein